MQLTVHPVQIALYKDGKSMPVIKIHPQVITHEKRALQNGLESQSMQPASHELAYYLLKHTGILEILLIS